MKRLLLDIALLVLLVPLAFMVWLGQQRPPDPYLQELQESGVLRVGTDPTYAPFEIARDGQIEGYDTELARALATDLGVRVEFVPLALDTLYDALEAGRVDMLISALPIIPERQADVLYSVPYYQAGQVIVVRAGERGVRSVDNLNGKRVGVELGSNADTEARRLARISAPGMELRTIYRSPDEALLALAAGEVDAAITDNTSAQAALRERPGTLLVLPTPITDEQYAVAMPAEARGLAAQVNATIERLRASGELARMMGLGR